MDKAGLSPGSNRSPSKSPIRGQTTKNKDKVSFENSNSVIIIEEVPNTNKNAYNESVRKNLFDKRESLNSFNN